MRQNLHFEQRSDGWLNQRKGRVTASAIGAIMGYNPYSKREDEMMRMLEIGKKFEGNAATEWGTFNEAGALVEFEMETGLQVEPAFFVEFEEWLGASPDGYVSDGRLIEIKCPYGLRNGGEFKSIHDQMHYYAQIQCQLFCTNLQECYIYQWSPSGTKLEIVKRDESFIKDMLIEARNFYEEYLLRKDKILMIKERLNIVENITGTKYKKRIDIEDRASKLNDENFNIVIEKIDNAIKNNVSKNLNISVSSIISFAYDKQNV